MKETTASFILHIRHDAEKIPLDPLFSLLFEALDEAVEKDEGVAGYSIVPTCNTKAGTEYMKSGDNFFTDAERARYIAMHENPPVHATPFVPSWDGEAGKEEEDA